MMEEGGTSANHSSCKDAHTFADLPDDLVFSILARLPFVLYPRLRCVSRAWNIALQPSGPVASCRRSLGRLEAWPLVSVRRANKPLRWFAIDPRLLSCHRIPPPSAILSDFAMYTQVAAGSKLCINAKHGFDPCLKLQFHCFDASTLQWHHSQVPGFERSHRSAILGDYWYTIGADYRDGRIVKRIHIGDPGMLLSWEQVPSMHCERASAQVISRQGSLYVLGGTSWRSGQRQYSGEVWNPQMKEWVLAPQLWPYNVFGGFHSVITMVAVVKGALFAVKRPSKELLCFHDDAQKWVKLGQVPVHNSNTLRGLLGVGSELWVLSWGDCYVADIEIVLSYSFDTLFTAPPRLPWRAVRFDVDSPIEFCACSTIYM